MSTHSAQSRSHALQLDRIFGALSHRTRRALLTQLQHRPRKVTELAKPFKMSLPAISKHVRILERAGLVQRRVNGRVHLCSLDPSRLRKASDWLAHMQTFWNQSLARLARYAEEEL